MKDKKMTVQFSIPNRQTERKPIWKIVNKDKNIIAYIDIQLSARYRETSNVTNVYINTYLTFDDYYQSTEQEQRTAEFLYRNVTNTIAYDIEQLFAFDLEDRINDALPIDIKIERVEKENISWQTPNVMN